MRLRFYLLSILFLNTILINAQHQNPNQELPKVEIFQKFELSIVNATSYVDPIRDVELTVNIKHQNGEPLKYYGF